VSEEVVPILRVADADAAVAWYARLGFAHESTHRFEPGLPAFVSVRRGDERIFLSEHEGDARPDTLLYLWVDDLDRIAQEFGVEQQTAGWSDDVRELELADPDGNRLRIGQGA
jgi:catechol 2,3-dioxygenase-like lactoylglutathione lyase family enzyme